MLDESHYIELYELEILGGIKSGDIVINERYLESKLNDRWLSHKNEKIDVQYIQPDEEMRIRRLA